MLQSERVRNFEGRAEQSGFNKRGDSKALKFKNQGSMASLNIVNSSVSLLWLIGPVASLSGRGIQPFHGLEHNELHSLFPSTPQNCRMYKSKTEMCWQQRIIYSSPKPSTHVALNGGKIPFLAHPDLINVFSLGRKEDKL